MMNELRGNIDALHADLEAVRAAWNAAIEKYGAQFPEAPARSPRASAGEETLETLQMVQGELRAKLAFQQEAMSEAEAAFRMRGLLANISGIETYSAVAPSSKASSGTETVVRRREQIAATVASLNPATLDSDRRVVEDACKAALAVVESSRFDGLRLELHLLVQNLNGKQRKRARDQSTARNLLDQLIGFEGGDALRLRDELRAVQHGARALRAGIEKEVSVATSAEAAAEDRQYAAKVIIEELERLGYETSSQMKTAFVSGKAVEITKRELQEYSVQFSVSPEQGQFDVHLERDASTSQGDGVERQLRDRRMEETWCADFASALSAAAKKGVRARVKEREKPGSMPVPLKSGTTTGLKRRANSGRAIGMSGNK